MGYMKMRMIIGCVLTWLTVGAPLAISDTQVYQQADDFIASTFQGDIPPTQALWIQPSLRDELSKRFGWRAGLRVRYWQSADRTAWILDEIGKERPITAGIVINNGVIERVEVLTFRESRGWEIRYTPFTEQFINVGLAQNNELNRPIDGITGATLSVRAMKRMARVALKLHAQTQPTTLAQIP